LDTLQRGRFRMSLGASHPAQAFYCAGVKSDGTEVVRSIMAGV
jgi:hypothetical protein